MQRLVRQLHTSPKYLAPKIRKAFHEYLSIFTGSVFEPQLSALLVKDHNFECPRVVPSTNTYSPIVNHYFDANCAVLRVADCCVRAKL